MRFLIDTHILIWFCNGSKNIPEDLRNSIEFYEHEYYVSVESLREIAIKGAEKGSGFLVNGGLHNLIENLNKARYNIKILNTTSQHIKTLEKLSKPMANHTDPFDRLIISQGISEKMIVVSSDQKFPAYKDRGFELFYIDTY